jgi:hypothetical protein
MFPDQLELFYGEVSTAAARVYAQLPADASAANVQLAGSVYGPFCLYAHTLPVRFPLVDAGPGKTLLAQTEIQEPCFWSPEMPYLYQTTIELRQAGNVIARTERLAGPRLLTIRSATLEWDREPYRLQGVYRTELSADELPDLHDAGTAVLIPSPDDALCEAASREGVLLLSLLAGSAERIESELRRLNRWPAAAIAVIDGELPEANLRPAARGMLLAQLLRPAGNRSIAPWAQLLVAPDKTAADDANAPSPLTRPVIVWPDFHPTNPITL